MKTFIHQRNRLAAALAIGLGAASGAALADREAILVTILPEQEVPGSIRIVDARGAVVVEIEQEDEKTADRGSTVAGNTIDRRGPRVLDPAR